MMRYLKIVVSLASLLLVSLTARAQQDFINNFAGGGPNNVPATSANVNYPQGTATDSVGNFYVVSASQDRVFKVSSGILTVLAGNGFSGYGGDGGPATQAELNLNANSQVAVDSAGNVYIADTNNCIVRVVNQTTGNISLFAGTPQYCSFGGDGGSATATGVYLYYPQGVAVDGAANVYIADFYNYRIREVSGGNINTVAGNGSFCYGYSDAPCGDGGTALNASLGYIYTLAVDSAGNVFIADAYYYNQVVRLFTVGGNINTVAGQYYPNVSCYQSGSNPCGDGGPATSAEFYYPYGIAADAAGNLFIADYYNYDVREVVCADSAVATCNAGTGTTKGDIYTVAGTGGSYGNTVSGPSTGASLGYATGIAVDGADDIFIPNYYYQNVQEAVLGGNISTVAGNGTLSYTGNGIPATNAVMNEPRGTTFDSAGNAYIADTDNCVVRKVDTSGVITLFAGTVGTCGFGGDGQGATATGTYLSYPYAVATDSAGNVYIADIDNYRIRKVDTGGNISTFAGDGGCFDGDGPATSHGVCIPEAVAVDAAGNVYIADTYDYRIRKVDTTGNMTTIAGNGNYGFSGDGGPATSATMTYPDGVAVDKAGNVYFTDEYNWRVRQINPAGIIDTYAGNGTAGYQGDGGPATQTSLYYPAQVAVDSAGDVIIADTSNQRIRLVDGQGLIHTVAGIGSYGYSGPEEDVLATTAELANPAGLGLDSSGNIYIGDTNNNLVREVTAVAVLNASRTSVVFNVQSTGTTSGGQQVTLTAEGPLAISSITVTGPFKEADDCGGGPPSGTSCVMDIVFTPPSSGTFTGTVTIADNGFFNTSVVINLTGYGSAVSVTPTSLVFTSETVGSTSTAKTVKVTNKSKTSNLTFGAVTTVGDFLVSSNTCTGSIAFNATCQIGVEFKPTQSGPRTGSLVINDSDGSSPQLVSLSGTGLGAGLSPTTVTFATQTVGTTSAAKLITLANDTSTPITGISAGITGANAGDFQILGASTCGSSLGAKPATCNYSVAFTPSVAGTESATLSVTDSDGTQTATLKGTGSIATLAPKSVNFGKVTVGVQSADKTVTLTNNSASTTLNISAITIAGTSPSFFAIDPTDPGSCYVGGSVLPGANCTINVNFTPGSTATVSATLQVTDDGAGPGSVQSSTIEGSGK